MPTSVKRLADFSNSQDPKRLQLPPMLALQSTKTRVAISDDPRILLAMLSIVRLLPKATLTLDMPIKS